MEENFFDQYDDEVAPSPMLTPRESAPDFFPGNGQIAPSGGWSTEISKGGEPATKGPADWQQYAVDGMSFTAAREAAQAKTQAEAANPRAETPSEASFWGAAEHGLGVTNLEAMADLAEHIGDRRGGDQQMYAWAESLRKSIHEDKSSYKAIYESYKQVRGFSDAWGYMKETAGEQLGVMAPMILSSIGMGYVGNRVGGQVGGSFGSKLGAVTGSLVGAGMASLPLQVSEMRRALKNEGMSGDNLMDMTEMGAGILIAMDSAFPAMQSMKIGGFAHKALAQKVAQKMAQNLAKGGKMRTVAEFVKEFGKDLARDTIKYEVTTELAQQAVTDLGSKMMAGKDVTQGDVTKFATETAPEVVIRTIIGAGFISAPGSAMQARRTINDVKKSEAFPGDDAQSVNTEGKADKEGLAEFPAAPIDGTPAIDAATSQQPQQQDASQELPAQPNVPDKGVGVLQFIRDNGGMAPGGDMDALDPTRYPGLVTEGGLTPDEMRERLVEAGYLEESGPDQPNITTPDDVYDLVERAIGGERVVPVREMSADDGFHAAVEARDAQKELSHSENMFVLPMIEQYDEEFPDLGLGAFYKKLSDADRFEAIDRARRGEDIADIIEEMMIRDVDVEGIQAMILGRGPDPVLIDRIRSLLAQQQPELLNGFDDMLAKLPVRKPRARGLAALNLAPEEHPGARPAEQLMALSKAELASLATRQGIKVKSKWNKSDIVGALSAAAATPGHAATMPENPLDENGLPAPEPAPVVPHGELPELPAVPVKRSVQPAAIVSLIDGSKHEWLSKHLEAHGVTLAQYAAHFNLAPDYPFVAPNTVARRYAEIKNPTVSYDEYAHRWTIEGQQIADEELALTEEIGKPVPVGLDAESAQRRQSGFDARATLIEAKGDFASTRRKVAGDPKKLAAFDEMQAAINTLIDDIDHGRATIPISMQTATDAANALESLSSEAHVKLSTQWVRSASRRLGKLAGPAPAAAAAAPASEATEPPTFDEISELLPLDDEGFADVAALPGMLKERFGKQYWGELTDAEKDAFGRELSGVPAETKTSATAPAPAAAPATSPVMPKSMEALPSRLRAPAATVAPAPDPAPAAKPTATGAQAKFASEIKEIAQRTRTEPFRDRVAIAQVYDEYAKAHPEVSIDTFKRDLVEAGMNRLIDLGRLDLPERMEKTLRDRSTARWGRDDVHVVLKERNIPLEFAQLVHSTTPRAQWGGILGLTDTAMRPHVDHAIALGLLRRDARGVIRRAPRPHDNLGFDLGRALQANIGDPNLTSTLLANLDALPDKEMRRASQVLTGKGYTKREVNRRKVVEAVKLAELREGDLTQKIQAAYKSLAKLPNDWVSLTQLRAKLGGSRADQDATLKRMFLAQEINLSTDDDQGSLTQADKDASLRIGMSNMHLVSMQGGSEQALGEASGLQAFIMPGPIAGAEVTLTPAAVDKVAELQSAVDEAMAGILPTGVRATVKQNVSMARAGRKDQLLLIAGLTSAGADLEAHARAIELERTGADRKKVWDETGWYRGTDSKWRYELNDDDARMAPGQTSETSGFIQLVFQHAGLYRAYKYTMPFRGRLEVGQTAKLARGIGGAYSPGIDRIRAQGRTKKELREVVLHELQHAVQMREQFAPGVSPILPGRPAVEQAKAVIEKVYGDLPQRIDAAYNIFKNSDDPAASAEARREWFSLLDEASKIRKATGLVMNPYEIAYWNSAGEVEARNVERRSRMTVEERRASPPWETQDVSDEMQVVVNYTGPSMFSMPLDITSTFVEESDTIAPDTKGVSRGSSAEKSARIVRAESATLRADGTIRAGRLAREGGPAVPGVDDAAALQPIGTIESFDIPGFQGVVEPQRVASHEALDRRGAPESEYKMASLVYRVYPQGLNPANFDEPLIRMRISQHLDGAWEVASVDVGDNAPKRAGLGTALYAAIEKDLGIRMAPSGFLTDEGYAFWKKRSPASVQWHQLHGGFYISPARVQLEIDLRGREMAAIARRADKPLRSDAEDMAAARKERGQLIKLWLKLPPEARLAVDSMFSVRAFHGTPHDFDRFDMSKLGTGEGAQMFGHGLYFAEEEMVARSYRDSLSSEGITLNGKVISDDEIATNLALDKLAGRLNDTEKAVREGLAKAKAAPEPTDADAERLFTTREKMLAKRDENIASAEEYLAKIEEVKAGDVKSAGQLYEVEIEVEPHQLLDWDKPLSEQSGEVMAAVEKFAAAHPNEFRSSEIRRWMEDSKNDKELVAQAERRLEVEKQKRLAALKPHMDKKGLVSAEIAMKPEMNAGVERAERELADVKNSFMYGARFYNALQGDFEGREVFTQALREAGIPGIRFLDQGSRDAGDGTRNIVIFDDSLVKITKKNGEPVSAAERKAAVDQMFSVRPVDPNRPDAGGLEALGRTDPYAEQISIGARAVENEARKTGRSMRSVAVTVARHEAMEFYKAIGLIQPHEWELLERAARAGNWVEETKVRKLYTKLYGAEMRPAQLEALILKESIAEMYGRYEAGSYVPEGALAKVFKRIKDFIEKTANALRGLGFQRWEDVFQKMDAGEFKARYEAVYQGVDTLADQIGEAQGAQAMIRAGQIPDARGLTPTIGAAPVRTDFPAASPGAVNPVTTGIGRAIDVAAGTIQPTPASALPGITEAINNLKTALGMTVRTGRIDPGLRQAAGRARAAGNPNARVLGQYNGVSRVEISNDIDVIAHEAGHHVERVIGAPLRALMQVHSAELTPLATMGNALQEGFAEFFRRFITNPASASTHAPRFFRDFSDLLDAHDPLMAQRLEHISLAYEQYLLGDPVEQGIANQTVLRTPSNAFTRFIADAQRDGILNTTGDMLHSLYQITISQNHGWWMATRDLLNAIEARAPAAGTRRGTRITLSAVDNAFKLLRMTTHTASWAQQDLKFGIALRARPNGGGVSMHQILATAFGGTDANQWNERATQEFGEYLIARRAIHEYIRYRPAFRAVVQAFVAANPRLGFMLHRLPQNVTSELDRPPTKESLNHQLEKLNLLEQRMPQFRAAAELYYQFNKDILLFLHEKHLLSTEEYNRLVEDRDYAPFQRDMSDREYAEGGAPQSRRKGRGRDQVNKRPVYDHFGGSMRDIINPIQSTVQFVYEMKLRAAINDTMRAMDRLAREAGQAGNAIFERLPPFEANAVRVEIREALRQAGRAAGMSPQDVTNMIGNVENQLGQNAVATLFTRQQAKERGERIVWFFENGEPVPAQLPDGELGRMMFEGLTAVGQRNSSLLTDILALPATWIRAGVTMSFEFIFRNMFVDSLTSMVNSPFARPGATLASGVAETWRGGQYQRLYNRYAGMMGGEAYAAISNQSIERDITRLRERGYEVRRPRNLREAAGMIFKLGEFSETSTRVGIYRNAMRSAMADGLPAQDAAVEAAHYAHDVYDFSQHGSKTEVLRRIIPFWNAAMIGVDKYTKTMLGANDYGTLIDIWMRYRRGQPLSVAEQRARGQAAKAWAISVLVFGGMSMIMAALGSDDEDQDEISDQLRATHWRFSIDGVLHFLPKSFKTFMDWDDDSDVTVRLPKPFEMAWFANATERAIDAAKGDKTAFQGFVKDFWATVIPPDSVPGLDVAYGFLSGKDFYTGNDIIPFFEKGLERADQFGPYTTETARRLGKALNMSPYYVDYLVRGLAASTGRDITSVVDLASGKGPAPSISEFPVARRFTYNTARSSKSLGKFYDMTNDREGLNSWFWDAASADARSFVAAGESYKLRVDSGKQAQADEFYDRLNPDQKAYATLAVDFQGKKGSKLRNLHPILNAQEGVTITNKLMKEIVDGQIRIPAGKTRDKRDDEFRPLDRNEMRFARNEVGHIRKGMAQNALQILGVEGWAQRPMVDVDKRLAVLKAGAPGVYEQLMARLKEKGYRDTKHLKKVWPDVKARLLAQRQKADISEFDDGLVTAE